MGLKSVLGGKPAKEKSESGNHAWGDIEDAFKPALGYVTQSGDALGNLLGLNGGPGQTAALENFANSGGMQFLREQGNKQITSNKAASGLLKSGSFGTALAKYGQGLGSTYLNQYMDNTFKLGQLGIGAGNTMTGAGAYSKGNSTGAKQGLGGMIAQGVGAAIGASDIELKDNIVPLGGGLYEFNYKQDAPIVLPKGRFVGYMAHEVPEEFHGPDISGYKTVTAPYLPKRIG